MAISAHLTNRMSHQQARIDQGIQSGQLNRPEAARLERAEARLDAKVIKDSFDGGGLTKRERVVDTALLDGMSARIYRQKHDGQTAG